MSAVFAEEGLEEQGNAALEGLKQFMYMGTDAIPLVVVSSPSVRDLGRSDYWLSMQEKLCLITMSLPAHYLCIEQVILALEVSYMGSVW